MQINEDAEPPPQIELTFATSDTNVYPDTFKSRDGQFRHTTRMVNFTSYIANWRCEERGSAGALACAPAVAVEIDK